MKKVRNLLLVLLAAVLCLLLLTGCGEKDVTVSVTLVNRSGREISSISITPSTSTEWDTEFVDGAFADGETISANLGTYKESEVPSAYNILVYNDENYILYDTSVDELDFAIQDGDYIIFLPPEGDVPIEIAHDYDPADYELDYAPTGYTEEELLAGGIVKRETPIRSCKVALFCEKCNKGVRVGYKMDGDKKVRICRKCGAEI